MKVTPGITGLPTQTGSRIMALGDSNTADGYSQMNPGIGQLGRADASGQAYLMWACLVSQGALRFGGVAATGGFTAAQVEATHLPTVIALKPGYCAVLVGTNDTGVTAFATWAATMTRIFQGLIAAGIAPIVCTLPPRNDLSGVNTNLTKQNFWLVDYAENNNLPLADFYGALAQDNGTFATGMNADNVHMNAAGAKVAGQTLWNAIKDRRDWPAAYLFEDQPATDTTRALGNNLFLTDSNADGVPDSWPSITNAPTTVLAVDATFGARSGKVLSMTRSGAGDGFVKSNAIALTVGDVVYFAIKFATSGVEAAGGSIDVRLCDNAEAIDLLSLFAFPIKDAAGLPPYMVLAGQVTAQSTANYKLILGIRTGGTLKAAQPTPINRTTVGI